MHYEYDMVGRVSAIEHYVVGQPPFLRMEYFYDERGLVSHVYEKEGATMPLLGVAHVVFLRSDLP